MPRAAGEVACADRLTNGASVRDAKAVSLVPNLQVDGSSRTMGPSVQCARVTGGGRLPSALADIVNALLSTMRPKNRTTTAEENVPRGFHIDRLAAQLLEQDASPRLLFEMLP